MRKIFTLMMIMIAVADLSIYSQTLSNTTWKVYDDSNIFYLYYHFGTDTISASSDIFAYHNIATYHEYGNNISIVDLDRTNSCPDSDTGVYNFSIQNDILKLALISDPCEERSIVISRYQWTRLLTEIQNTDFYPTPKIYPNPANDILFIQSPSTILGLIYIIYDQFGREVLHGKLINENTSVDIKHLPAGSYYVKIGEKSQHLIQIIPN
jgi:hypothetical protein